MPDRTRRTELADAAITTLARVGSRGLTHREVDRVAGVVEGSTSYYFRTRSSLLQASVDRLAELDTAAVPGLPTGGGSGREGFVRAFAGVVEELRTAGRDRLLARYELALEATRRPELRAALAAGESGLRAVVAERFEALGVSQPGDVARDFLVLLDGVLFSQVTGEGDRVVPGPELPRLIGRLLDACGVPRQAA